MSSEKAKIEILKEEKLSLLKELWSKEVVVRFKVSNKSTSLEQEKKAVIDNLDKVPVDQTPPGCPSSPRTACHDTRDAIIKRC